MTDSSLNITPLNGWVLTVASLSSELDFYAHTEKWPPKPLFKFNLSFAGSLAVEKAIRSEIARQNPDKPFVEVRPFPLQGSLKTTQRSIKERFNQELAEIIQQTSNEGKGFLLAFSVSGGPQLFDILDIIRFVRKKSEGRAVCIVGGSTFGFRHPEMEEMFFQAGADIINIGGAHEFAKWAGSLTEKSLFYRDSNGHLHLPIPQAAPFFTATENAQTATVGSAVSVPPSLNDNRLTINLPNGGCENRCGFCASPAHVRNRIRASHLTGDLVEETQKILLNQGKKGALSRLPFGNLNPMQNEQTLLDFLQKIDLSLVSSLGFFFGDILSFREQKGAEQHLDLFDKILTKHSTLRIGMGLSFDAIQYENDGAFLQRRAKNRLLEKEDYKSILKNALWFFKEESNRPWRNRVQYNFNFLMHPAMTPDVYQFKIKWADFLLKRLKRSHSAFGVLEPFVGSRIAENWQGHYAPPLYMEKRWTLDHLFSLSTNFSVWGNQFAHGDLLDCYAVSQIVSLSVPSMQYANPLIREIINVWEGNKKDLRLENPEIEINQETLRSFKETASDIVHSGAPRVLTFLELLLDVLLEQSPNLPQKEELHAKHALYGLLKAINERERFLMSKNKTYAKNPLCQLLVERTRALMMADSFPKEIKDTDRRIQARLLRHRTSYDRLNNSLS